MKRTWAEINTEFQDRGTLTVGEHTLSAVPKGVAVTVEGMPPRNYKKLDGAARANGITQGDLNGLLDVPVGTPSSYKTPKPMSEREKALGKATGEVLKSLELSPEQRVKMNGALRGAMGAVNREGQTLALISGNDVISVAEVQAHTQVMAEAAMKTDDPVLAVKEHTSSLREQTAELKQEWNKEQMKAKAKDVETDSPDR
jgi:hypothetical protein